MHTSNVAICASSLIRAYSIELAPSTSILHMKFCCEVCLFVECTNLAFKIGREVILQRLKKANVGVWYYMHPYAHCVR